MWTGGIISNSTERFGLRATTIGAFLFAIACAVHAEPSPTSQPSASPGGKQVSISFLPPPVEGTISLGIYDSKGSLVRVLHREADVEEFEIGSDALKTTWDGKNDAGEALPAGKYHARGYAVEAEVDGVGYFFNDWVSDEHTTRIRRINNLRLVRGEQLAMLVTFAGGVEGSVTCDLEGNVLAREEPGEGREDERFLPERAAVKAESGKLSLHRASGWEEVSWPTLVAPQAADRGKGDTIWVIDRDAASGDALILKQLSRTGDFLRRMAFPAHEPQPKIIQASDSEENLYLLDESSTQQRVRRLSLASTANQNSEATLSDWKVEFEKKIVAHKDFTLENGKPVLTGTKAPPDSVTIKLQPNRLQKNAPGKVEVAVGYDTNGCFLKTPDGLPLLSVSETPHLVHVVLTPNGEKAVDVFQDDEAVVEQFRVTKLDQMMAFDAGEFELK